MIEALHITNFQSHEDTYIEFHPGVNVIVAPSRYGKSAILRSMRWCTENKPTGDRFRSRWGGPTSSTIYFKNGSVSRVKDTSENSYTLTTKDGVFEYSGFGTKVPEPITDFINMDRVNWHRQMDSHFMLGWGSKDRGGSRERGLYLNKITNLEIIDQSISNIKKMITDGGKQESHLKLTIESLEKKQKEYDFLDSLGSSIAEMENQFRKMVEWESQADTIMDLVEKIERCENRIASYGDVDGAMKSISVLEALERGITEITNEAEDIESVLQDIQSAERIIKTKERELKAMEDAFEAAFPDICPLCGK